jgi:hypothetical protein
LRVAEEIRTGDMPVNSGLGATEMLRSHVNARAIEAVCRLTANSLDLETLMRIILDTASSACATVSVRVQTATE